MPIVRSRPADYPKQRSLTINWDNWRKGLNTLLNETEIANDELAQAENIVLVGRGSPTKRWGYSKYFLAGSAGAVRGLQGYYSSTGTNELLAITDAGYMTKRSGASYTLITGASWASGYNAQMTQLEDYIYVVNGQRELVRYDGSTLVGFPTLSTPSGVNITQSSGASGTFIYSYRISAISRVGETVASTPVSLTSQPQDLSTGPLIVAWTAISAASGDLVGYGVYGRNAGDERFISRVGIGTLRYIDDGTAIPFDFTYPPLADGTGGVKAKYIARYQDRLIYGGISGDGSKVIISGRAPLQERNDLASGGNYIRIEPDAGDDITGISTFGDRIIVFKERSIWEITLSDVQLGNFFITVPNLKLITASRGCIAPRSIAAVENDILFLSRDGVYVLGYEPNLAIDVLRTNELSAKIRPEFRSLTPDQLMNATAVYFETKYIISFPGQDKSYIYDRERLSWVGPWTFDTETFLEYFDSSDERKLVFGADDSAQVYEMADSIKNDDGSAIVTALKTKKTDFGDWTVFKTINDLYSSWRNVAGDIQVNIRLEDRFGSTLAAKSFDLASSENNSGFGADMWGSFQWGDSNEEATTIDPNEIVRFIKLNRTARRMQISISTLRIGDNYELLSLRTMAKPIGRGLIGSGWRV